MSTKIRLAFNEMESDVMDDKDIEESYFLYYVDEITWDKPGRFPDEVSGNIVLLHKDGENEGIYDCFTLYDDGSVSLGRWYPEPVHEQLSEYIRNSRLFVLL